MSLSTGQAYAKAVALKIALLQAQGKQLGGFICELLQGVGGNLIMPAGYLKAVYSQVRAAGGVCIADEVQVGFGRVSSHWWAFETQDVVPDIVTLGKPIGKAVLDTIEREDLRANGLETGAYLMAQLKALQDEFPIIGDVHDQGLFIGVELVLDSELSPATLEANRLIENLKSRYILLSLDGPFNNVLKIKPPMVFNLQDVDYFIALRA